MKKLPCHAILPCTQWKILISVTIDTISFSLSQVGSQLIRGISGGERKRTCIGMELINSPSVLFLDEPTTGLDASTAGAVMKLLHR